MELKIPPPLGLALTLVRSALGWGQKELAAVYGTSSSVLSDYERGHKPLSRKRLDGLVRVLGLPPEATDEALEFQRRMQAMARAPGHPDEAAETERQRIEGIASEVGNAFEEAARSVLSLITVEGRALAARHQARRIWERLKRQSPAQRRVLVEEKPELRSWALCELLCAESIKAAADDADRAVELAELALRIADLVPGEQPWRWRVQAYAWAHVGNSRRVKGDLPGAEEAFISSGKLWEAGAPGDPGLLDAWRLLDLEVSLRKDQRRLPEALALLDRALKVVPSGDSTARLLINKANVLELSGHYEDAIRTLREVAPLVSPERDLRLLWLQRFTFAVNLCHVGCPEEAEGVTAELRILASRLGNGLDSLRLRWLEGRVAEGLGRTDEALEAFSQVRGELIARGITYDAALVTLELTVLYLKQGRTREVKLMARQMAPIFQTQGVHREALAALKLFRRAAEEEVLTLNLARRLVEYLYRARHDPDLEFEAGE